MAPPDSGSTLTDCGTTHQSGSARDRLRPLSVEQLIREARDAGYAGSQRRLSRLARAYVSARRDESFTGWLYSDPTASEAIRNVSEAGW